MSPSDSPPACDIDLYEHAPCGLLLTDASGAILRVNATFCQWTGYQADELLGKRFSMLFTMGGRIFHQTHWVPLLQMQGSIAEVKLDVLHRDGQSVPMLFNALLRRRGEVVEHEVAAMVVNDRHAYEHELLIARRRAEQALAAQQAAQRELERSRDALEVADRRKDEFLATLAHELRNPLSAICNARDALRLPGMGPERQSRLFDIVDRQTRVLSRLVDDLLDISRIAGGKVHLRRQTVLMEEALRHAIEAAQPMISAAGHRLTLVVSPIPVAVNADPVRLQQIVLNLLTNAVKYTPPGGQIDVRVEPDGEMARISVSDSGVGIPPDQLDSVFELFSQLTPALERSQQGLGIGLALVRGLVHLHGGTIEAQSEGEGRGSQFIVRLPMTTVQAVSTGLHGMPQIERHAEGSLRLVLIDDNEDGLESLAMLLQSAGCDVHTATDGHSGLKLALSVRPDAVLLDIGLPDMSGYDVARHIRQHETSTRMLLIAVSGWGQQEDKRAAYEAGFDQHITKPVDFKELISLLGSIGREPRDGPS